MSADRKEAEAVVPGEAPNGSPERLIRRRVSRAVARRRVFPFLAGAITLLALGSGILARLLDHEDFHTFGDGVWWAIVTLGTVGYGDIVPHTGWGRFLGAIVIVCGVTFISLLTAIVTSLFVAGDQAEAMLRAGGAAGQVESETDAALHRIEQQLAAIEARLDRT